MQSSSVQHLAVLTRENIPGSLRMHKLNFAFRSGGALEQAYTLIVTNPIPVATFQKFENHCRFSSQTVEN